LTAKSRICAVLTNSEPGVIGRAGQRADLFELRLDLIGQGWPGLVEHLNRPWIATCRPKSEGGAWNGSEAGRKEELLRACHLGAAMIDLEINTPNLERLSTIIRKQSGLIVSYHNYEVTPPLEELVEIVERLFEKGADIAKVATLANQLQDNITVLNLLRHFRDRQIAAMAMGEPGICSRLLGRIAGSVITFAAVSTGLQSAAGQLTVDELEQIYTGISL